jgi:hypothetical protein
MQRPRYDNVRFDFGQLGPNAEFAKYHRFFFRKGAAC